MLRTVKATAIRGLQRDRENVSSTAASLGSALYRYRPLETEFTIRILALYPYEDEAERSLSGDLLHVPIDSFEDDPSLTALGSELTSCTSYEALSYAWGQPVFCRSVVCNGRPLPITESLHSALKRFRLADRIRYLWADAVCINQSDHDERSSQVALMSRIYSTAKHVLVWLGEDHVTENCLRYIEELDWSNERPDNSLVVYGDHYDALRTSPYFSRRWILQELSLAKTATLHCGQASINWDLLLRVCHRVPYMAVDLHSILSIRPKGLSRNQASSSPTHSLIELLDKFKDFECKDDRDRIYALLGLRMRADNLDIKPDYSISTSECYVQLALECLKQDSYPLRILHYAGESRYSENLIRSTGLPSWVPDWRFELRSARGLGNSRARWPATEKPRFTASSELLGALHKEPQADTLRIWGIHLGHIIVMNDSDSVGFERASTSLGFELLQYTNFPLTRMRMGDVACWFYGAASPFTLRSRDEDFMLAGACDSRSIPHCPCLNECTCATALKDRVDLERRWFVIR